VWVFLAMSIAAMAYNIKEEFGTVNLGDKRRNWRLRALAGRLAASPALSVGEACGSWAETMAAYRLVQTEAVTPRKILAAHQEATLARAKGRGSLLLIQDTTEFDFSAFKTMRGTGPLSELDRRGFFVHNRLLVTENEGLVLGHCGAQIWAREDQDHGKRARRKIRPIEEKESWRWLQGYRQACGLARCLPGQEVIMVADREGDIYEIYEAAQRLLEHKPQGPRAELIVRASVNRALSDGPLLFDTVRQAPLLGTCTLEIKATVQEKKGPGGTRHKVVRQARTARLEVRSTRVRLRGPHRPGGALADLELTAVVAREINVPEGQDPVEWILLSTLPVEDFAAAKRLLDAYRLRWLIEEFYRIVKTGCRVEKLSFAEAASVQVLLALYLVVAWRILFLRQLSRSAPALPASCFFSELEWRMACIMNRKPADRAPPLNQMVILIAKLGGYFGRANDPAPGAQVIWRGLVKLHCYVEAAEVLKTF
jgi:IS4 transposase